IAALVYSLSRGGLVALVAGGAVALLLQPSRRLRGAALAPVLVAVLAAVGLVAWFGADRVEARLATLWKGEALQEERLPMWQNVLPLARDFPIWGTGLGTFSHVEPLTRRSVDDDIFSHADNDYLEALVEGGVVRLLISLLAIVCVLGAGLRALRRYRGRT